FLFLQRSATSSLHSLPYTTLFRSLRPVEYLSGALLFTMFKLALGWGVMILGAWALFHFNVFTLGFALPTLILVLMVFGVALSMVDRKSTRLNSSHEWISYAVFCLK